MNKQMPSIAISGFGLVLPGCDDGAALWQRWQQQDSAISTFQHPHLHSKRYHLFGHLSEAQLQAAQQQTPHKMRRYASPSSQWGLLAVQRALDNAQLQIADVAPEQWGLFTAQGDHCYPGFASYEKATLHLCQNGGFDAAALRHQLFHERGGDPFVCIKSLTNNLLATVSLSLQLKGDCGAYGHDEQGAIAALRQAILSLQQGKSRAALVVLSGSQLDALHLSRLMQQQWLHESNAFYPIHHAARNGLILGDGAVALLLETVETAISRQHTPHCRVDVTHQQAPTTSSFSAPYLPLLHGLAQPDQPFDAIVADFNGHPTHDKTEHNAIQALRKNQQVQTHCAGDVTGHLTAARLGLQLQCAALLLQHQSDTQHVAVTSHSLLQQFGLLHVSSI